MHLSTGLAVILVFVGLKMVLVDVIKIPTYISLIVIALIITASIVFSLIKTKNEKGLDSDVV